MQEYGHWATADISPICGTPIGVGSKQIREALMPNIDWNRDTWDRQHDWSEAGDEWSGMAAHCDQPYGAWKQALIDELLTPRLRPGAHVVEVAPGHGRFTEHIAGRVANTTLVDLSPTCLELCRERFGDDGVAYVLTDGASLPGVGDASVDFIWSFDSFVHMERDVIDAYLHEFRRVLRRGGTFTIHHAGKTDWTLRLVPLTSRLGTVGRVAQRLVSQRRLRDSGRRADVSREQVSRLAAGAGLTILTQRRTWGPHGEFSVAKYGDWITTGVRAA